jgi:clorobiocin biosynthesis protein CloN4
MLAELVRAAARDRSDAPAVSGPDGRLTYGELDALADRQAGALRAAGVRPGDRVVLWSGKLVAAVAAMQAVLRAGAVYVPVSGSNPAARAAGIAADCAAVLVLAPAAAVADAGAWPEDAGRLLAFEDLAGEPGTTVDRRAEDDPAYVLYTSGSTGRPKGVVLSHRNALAFVAWAGDLLAVGPDDRLSNHANFNFDLSVFDLYAAFRAGAAVHLVPEHMSYAPKQLVQFLWDEGVTVWYSVPSAVVLMIRDGGLLDGPPPPGLRTVVVAGEPMPMRAVRELRAAWPHVRLLNWYGPTETNVCTSYEVGPGTDLDRPLPIGTAAAGDSVVLDPPGAEGEIVVTGPTVMLGYWGRPRHEGPYRTGDLGRLAADGALEYAGRLDDMVKVRGNRVEPAEIEAVVATHPAVARVVVVVLGVGIEGRLHAVLETVPGTRGPGLLELKRLCAARLPTYMIVDSSEVVAALPLTPNGKVDRAGLVAARKGSDG